VPRARFDPQYSGSRRADPRGRDGRRQATRRAPGRVPAGARTPRRLDPIRVLSVLLFIRDFIHEDFFQSGRYGEADHG